MKPSSLGSLLVSKQAFSKAQCIDARVNVELMLHRTQIIRSHFTEHLTAF
jgi:hypothetical protein